MSVAVESRPMHLLQGVAALPDGAAITSISPIVVGGAVLVTAVLSGCLAYLYVVDVTAEKREAVRTTLLTVIAPLLLVFVVIVLANLLTDS